MRCKPGLLLNALLIVFSITTAAGIANYSGDLLARDVVGALDTVAASKAFVVGHDWGAAVTWYLAARYSRRLSRIAILGVPTSVCS
jgi:pimeloyl-ACP methyl ester carboxylesterase